MWFALLLWQSEAIDVSAREDGANRFVVEGKAALPDDAIVTVELFRAGADLGPAVWFGAATVHQGKFRRGILLFKEKNIKGRYVFRVRFEPDLQRPEHKRLRPTPGEAKLTLGTDEEAREEAARWARTLDIQMEEMADLLAGARRRFEKDRDGGNPTRWLADMKALAGQFSDAVQKNVDVPEYRFLGLTPITHGRFERLRWLAVTCIECWKSELSRPQEAAIWSSSAEASFDAFGRLRQTVRAQLGLGPTPRVDLKKSLSEAGRCVKETAGLFEASLEDGRRRAELRASLENRRILFRGIQEDLEQSPAGAERDDFFAAAKEFFDRAAAFGENPTREGVEALRGLRTRFDAALEALRAKLE